MSSARRDGCCHSFVCRTGHRKDKRGICVHGEEDEGEEDGGCGCFNSLACRKVPQLKAGLRGVFSTMLDVQGGETDRTAFFSTEVIFFLPNSSEALSRRWAGSGAQGSTAHAHKWHNLLTFPRARKWAKHHAGRDPQKYVAKCFRGKAHQHLLRVPVIEALLKAACVKLRMASTHQSYRSGPEPAFSPVWTQNLYLTD